MPEVVVKALVTTLTAQIEAADALYEQGRLGAALTAYRDLLDRAQERSDRAAETVARAMVARCLLVGREPDRHLDEVEQHLEAIALYAEEQPLEVQARVEGTRARTSMARAGRPEDADITPLRAYLDWADEQGHGPSLVDACVLLARAQSGEERATWLSRAVDEAEVAGRIRQAGQLALELGGVLDALDRPEEAVRAYRRAQQHQESHGTPRGVVSAAWAKGSVRSRIEDDAEAREALEEAVKRAEGTEDARDILALALADLARVHESAGDVVEARRLILRAVRIAREEDLPSLWPDRWQALVAYGRRLELDV